MVKIRSSKFHIKIDDAFNNPDRELHVLGSIFNSHIRKVLDELTDWDKYGKEVIAGILALKDAGKHSDHVTLYKNGNANFYKDRIKYKNCLDITIRDPNFTKLVALKYNKFKKYNDTPNNLKIVDFDFLYNYIAPFEFCISTDETTYISTFMKLQHVLIHSHGSLTVTLEET